MAPKALLVCALLFVQCNGQLQHAPWQSSMCPFGFVHANSSSDSTGVSCVCNPALEMLSSILVCNNVTGHLEIYQHHCVTYSDESDSIFAGFCPYNQKVDHDGIMELPWNITETRQNEIMCGPFNRKGRICGQCKNGYGPSVSYSPYCKRCHSEYGWMKYLMIQIFPSTLMFFIIVIFEIQLTKSPLNAFVLFCQMLVALVNHDVKVRLAYSYVLSYRYHVMYRGLLAFYGIFNLDFYDLFPFHNFSDVCISSSFSGIQVLVLRYVEAFYPLVLIGLVYTCVALYDRNCKLFVVAWNRLRTIHPYRNSSFSVAKAIAAYLTLAHTKLLLVSLNLLIPDIISEINDKIEVQKYLTLYYDPTLEYFGKEHIPYAVFAILVLLIFVFTPLLILMIFPYRPFVRFLRVVTGSKWHALMSHFIDIFQGWFKNGTGENSSHDCRIVSAFFPLFKLLVSVWIVLFTGLIYRGSHIWIIPSLVLQVTGFIFALLRPYYITAMNQYDAALFWILGTFTFICISDGYMYMHLALAVGYIPAVWILGWIVVKTSHWINAKYNIVTSIRCKLYRLCRCQAYNDDDNDENGTLLPHTASHSINDLIGHMRDSGSISYGTVA